MKNLFRQPGLGPQGYSALIVFALAYAAALALVIAPDQVMAALDTLDTLAP